MISFPLIAAFMCLISLTRVSGFVAVPSPIQQQQQQQKQQRSVGRILLFESKPNGEEPDLFDYFDPLLSPHAYPDGISPNQPPKQPQDAKAAAKASKPTNSSSKRRKVGFDLPNLGSNQDGNDDRRNPPANDFGGGGSVISPDVFDPTISPHAYANGTPNVVVGDNRSDDSSSSSSTPSDQPIKTIGVLLIDHGSKKEAANERLLEVARQYQSMVDQQQQQSPFAQNRHTIVAAAHMELAQPSIRNALGTLLEENENIYQIICHPYFLSAGRHVEQDIPQLVEQAWADLGAPAHCSIRITPPTGSHTNLMIQAIDSLVDEAATTDSLE